MTKQPITTVKLMFYKDTGKFYSSEQYDSSIPLHDGPALEIQAMILFNNYNGMSFTIEAYPYQSDPNTESVAVNRRLVISKN